MCFCTHLTHEDKDLRSKLLSLVRNPKSVTLKFLLNISIPEAIDLTFRLLKMDTTGGFQRAQSAYQILTKNIIEISLDVKVVYLSSTNYYMKYIYIRVLQRQKTNLERYDT